MSSPTEGVHPHVPELLTRIQACVDQIVGFLTVIWVEEENPFPQMANQHIDRVMGLLQEQLDGLYCHLEPMRAEDYVSASQWLLKALAERR